MENSLPKYITLTEDNIVVEITAVGKRSVHQMMKLKSSDNE